MSDNEDDYLSDKFLVETAAPAVAPKTYAERRKEAQRLAAIKNEQNRTKSKRQLELESREEGLSKSLFERAKEQEASGQQNKALAMMMKMGFKPGQSLGLAADEPPPSSVAPPPKAPSEERNDSASDHGSGSATPGEDSASRSRHIVAPLPLNEWAGRKGIGLGKRAASPSAFERIAKMAKMAEERDHSSFRDRARQEYEERQAEGRLGPAQRTCVTLDEKAGREFNILWLNPNNPHTFPEGLLDALDDPVLVASLQRQRVDDTFEGRLRSKMQADALQPLRGSLEDEDDQDATARKAELRKTAYSAEDLEEATQFLRLAAKDRLQLVLDYLRRKYAYCFWCGTQYEDHEDLENNCPGTDEEAHD